MARRLRALPDASEQLELPFLAAFEGPEVDAGRMGARDFAPSLLATSTLIESAAEAMFGFPDAVSVQVRADFRKGSFEFGLIVAAAASLGQQIFSNMSLRDLETLLKGIGYLGKSPKSLLRLLLKIGDKPVQRIEATSDGKVSVHVQGDNNTIIIAGVDARIGHLINNEKVRDAIPGIVAPLSKPGITAYRIGSSQKPDLKLTKSDLPQLKSPGALKSPLADSTATTALELLSPNFVDGNKWRVAQGGEPLWARMLDDNFLGAVDRGERVFIKGDFLIVDLRTRAFSTPEGLIVERDIVLVIDHRHRAKQLTLG